MKLLEHTFQHLPGFGQWREQELRKWKIFTWEDFENVYKKQLSLGFEGPKSIVYDSKERLSNGDVDYFVENLPGDLHYYRFECLL
jgi:hypothetical protein